MECLITKLKGSVTESNLLKVGEFKVESTNGGVAILVVVSKKDSEARILNNTGVFYSDKNMSSVLGDTVVIPKNERTSLHFSGGADVAIYDDYGCTELRYMDNINASIEPLRYRESIGYVNSVALRENLSGDVSVFANKFNLNLVSLLQTSITGDISVFADCNLLTVLNLTETDVYGDIASIGHNIKLSTIGIANTKVSGSINEFVQKQISAGRESGKITFLFPKASIATYNGVKLKDSQELPTNTATSAFSWTSDGTITWS